MSDVALSFREELFSPSEAARCTDLSITMQRDWRRQGHLAGRAEGGSATSYLFRPRELAEMRLLVKLRLLGLGPSEGAVIAKQLAPTVLYLALRDHEKTWRIEADQERGLAYKHSMRTNWDTVLRMMAGVNSKTYPSILRSDSHLQIIEETGNASHYPDSEVTGWLDCLNVANKLAQFSSKPLYTILVPHNFK
jgi:hypothetical protein